MAQGFSAFLVPLQETFGWSQTILALPRSVTSVENSILGPIEGHLVDKYGPRRIVTIGVIVMGLGFILFGLTQNVFMYFLANIVLALGTGLQGLLIMSVAVNNWFRIKRSMSNAIMLLGFPLAGAVGVPALVFLLNAIGWQMSAVTSGLIIWAVGIPCAQLLRTGPEEFGLDPDGIPPEKLADAKVAHAIKDEYDFTLKEALHTRVFWFLAFGWALGNLGMGAAQTFVFLHLQTNNGMSAVMVGAVVSVTSFANIPSRLLGGYFGDRLQKHIVIGVATLAMGAGIYLLSIAHSAPMAFAYAILYGIGWGLRTPAMNAIQGEYFGRKSQGVIRGWLQMVSMPFMIVAPTLTGYLADIQGTYQWAFTGVAALTVIAAVLVFMSPRPKPPQHAELQS